MSNFRKGLLSASLTQTPSRPSSSNKMVSVGMQIISAVELGSVLGPLIQANGRLSFEDDLRSGVLLYCASTSSSSNTLGEQQWDLLVSQNREMKVLSW